MPAHIFHSYPNTADAAHNWLRHSYATTEYLHTLPTLSTFRLLTSMQGLQGKGTVGSSLLHLLFPFTPSFSMEAFGQHSRTGEVLCFFPCLKQVQIGMESVASQLLVTCSLSQLMSLTKLLLITYPLSSVLTRHCKTTCEGSIQKQETATLTYCPIRLDL
jgi:hypothetical protein